MLRSPINAFALLSWGQHSPCRLRSLGQRRALCTKCAAALGSRRELISQSAYLDGSSCNPYLRPARGRSISGRYVPPVSNSQLAIPTQACFNVTMSSTYGWAIALSTVLLTTCGDEKVSVE